MFTLFFLFVLVFFIQYTNKKNGEENDGESMVFEFKDSLIILGVFLFSFLLNFIFKNFLPHIYLLAAGISILPDFIIVSLVNTHRERSIQKRHEMIDDVYKALADIMGHVDTQDIDYSNVPFQWKYSDKKQSIEEIIIDTSAEGLRIDDNTITTSTYSLNKFLGTFQWLGSENPQERELTFRGLPKAPDIAKFPGSDYHSSTYYPIGVSGKGEVGWYKTKDPKGIGFSNYRNEDGIQVDSEKMATSPQMLVGGSTGGGKAVWVDQLIEIKDN